MNQRWGPVAVDAVMAARQRFWMTGADLFQEIGMLGIGLPILESPVARPVPGPVPPPYCPPFPKVPPTLAGKFSLQDQ